MSQDKALNEALTALDLKRDVLGDDYVDDVLRRVEDIVNPPVVCRATVYANGSIQMYDEPYPRHLIGKAVELTIREVKSSDPVRPHPTFKRVRLDNAPSDSWYTDTDGTTRKVPSDRDVYAEWEVAP